jgi:oxygen-dependent protoporphyrinogen oxidase
MFPETCIVVGGGIAGLAAAYDLTRAGSDVVVVEAAERPGGLILTERVDGFLIDAGPDSLLAQKPAGLQLCAELGLADRLQPTLPPRTAFVLRNGRLHALTRPAVLGVPASWRALFSSTLLSWPAKLRVAIEPLVPADSRDDESIGSFMRRRFGQEVVDYIAEPLMAGIHAGDVHRLSMHALFPALVDAERAHRSVLRTPGGSMESGGQGAFRSLPDGIGELVDAIVRALPVDAIRCGASVTRLIVPDGVSHPDWTVRLSSGEELQGRTVLLAVPAYVTADLVEPFDAELARLCREITYVSTASVALAYPAAAVRHPLAGTGFVVPRVERATRITAATWVTSKWPGRAPPGGILIRAFAGGLHDPDAVDLDDRTLVDLAHDTLASLLGIGVRPQLSRTYRWRRSGAQHEVGHLARVASIEARASQWPGLFLTGSAYRASGIPDCIADARGAAARVRDRITRAPMRNEQ